MDRSVDLTLYGYSPHVIPVPGGWGANCRVTGYWFLDEPEGWQPPEGLEEFLAAGEAPVYVGFGSMGDRDAERTTAVVIEALAELGRRAVPSSGWGGLSESDLPDGFFMVGSVPHSWLFPRVAAVPACSPLSVEKLRRRTGHVMRPWAEALREYVRTESPIAAGIETMQ